MTAKRSETDVVGHDPELAGAMYEREGDARGVHADGATDAGAGERPDTVRDLNRFQSKTVPPELARAMLDVDLGAIDDGGAATADEPLHDTPGPIADPEPHEIATSRSAPRGRRRAVAIGVVTALVAGVVLVVVIGGRNAPPTPATLPAQRTAPLHATAAPQPASPATATAPAAAPRSSAAPAGLTTALPAASGTAARAAPAPRRPHAVHAVRPPSATVHKAPPRATAPVVSNHAPQNSPPNSSGFPY
jgi:hypothetical protein